MHSKDEYCRESWDELAEGQFSDQIQESHVVIHTGITFCAGFSIGEAYLLEPV
jgi:hypothetical protein